MAGYSSNFREQRWGQSRLSRYRCSPSVSRCYQTPPFTRTAQSSPAAISQAGEQNPAASLQRVQSPGACNDRPLSASCGYCHFPFTPTPRPLSQVVNRQPIERQGLQNHVNRSRPIQLQRHALLRQRTPQPPRSLRCIGRVHIRRTAVESALQGYSAFRRSRQTARPPHRTSGLTAWLGNHGARPPAMCRPAPAADHPGGNARNG